LTEFSLKGGGFEASAKRTKAEASAALIAATVAHQEAGATPETLAKDAKAAAIAVEAVTPRTIRRARKANVLWVDDRPNNNNNERQALEALGINFGNCSRYRERLSSEREADGV
jgi:hypothetical protein